MAVARFLVAVAWFCALLQGGSASESLFPLEQLVHANPESVRHRDHQAHVEFDASPWGGGGVLRQGQHLFLRGTRRYVASSTPERATPSGNPSESWPALLVTLFLWGTCGNATRVIKVDDVAPDIISLKGKGSTLIVAREIAWRRVRHRWHFRCEHVLAESNAAADSLSRLSAIPAKAFPTEVAHATRRTPPMCGTAVPRTHVAVGGQAGFGGE